MAYQALYRKFRPAEFEGVVGQEHIVKTLKNEIISDMVSHAYLFCGTRGTGKTSTAKIFAKAINCLDLKEGEPCGKCSMCQAMQEGRSVNVIEIDAASNNGVDNIRDIREEVKYPPTEGKFKVYIIDEVHMLSQGAFNALLKTLEEPPSHVIFILATTDPQKVPVTILSRCQRFDFRRITSGEIARTLKKYVKIEKANVEDSALMTVGRLADGSMRDSISILDQCLAFYHNEVITEEKVLEVCGATDSSVFFEMVDAIAGKKSSKAMDIIDEITYKGRDIGQFNDSFLQHLRNLLVVSSVEDTEDILDMSQENIKLLKEQTKKISPEEIIYLIRVFSQLSADMKYASNKRILFEVEIIKLCSNVVRNDIDYLASRLSELERKLKSGAYAVSEGTSEKKEKKEAKKEPPKKKAVPTDIIDVRNNWRDIVSQMENPYDRELFLMAQAGYMEDGRVTVICEEGYSDITDSKRDVLIDTLLGVYNKIFEVRTITKDEYENYERINFNITNEDEEDAAFMSILDKFSEIDIIE